MKAYISTNGELIIEAENETEHYALSVWIKESNIEMKDVIRNETKYIRGSKIKIF